MLDSLEEKYFSNIGKRLKKLAVASFLIEIVCEIIAGIIMFFAFVIEGIFLAALLVPFGVIVSFLVAWLLNVPIYAIGELVDKTSYTAKKTKEINEKLSCEEDGEKKNSAPKSNVSTSNLSNASKDDKKPSDKAWACGKCGYVNSSGIYCKDCGEYKGKAGYREVKKTPKTPSGKTLSKDWVCKKCGEKNASGMYCRSCGEYK